jgi:hypothetical protein
MYIQRHARWPTNLPQALAVGLFLVVVNLPSMAQSSVTASLRKEPALFSTAPAGEPPAPWRVVGLPNANKPLTRFDVTTLDGRQVLRVQADHSYANLLHELAPAVPGAGTKVNWRWRLDQPLLDANLRQRKGDDAPLKICLLFNMPAENLGFLDRELLAVARASTKEHVPAATICYVWDHSLPSGTLLNNAFTSRIREFVVDSGEEKLGQWTNHQRDITADFRRAFGKESATVPPLEAVLIGADADNTAGKSLGYVGDVTLGP